MSKDLQGLLNAIFDAENNALRTSSSSSSSGSLAVIGRTVVGVGGAASIDFTSIPADYESLRVVYAGRGTAAVTDVELRLRLNNDSAANYDWRNLFVSEGGITTATAAGETSARFAATIAASATAGKAGTAAILIPSYARTVFHKTMTGEIGYPLNETTGIRRAEATAVWRSTAAVTQITLLLSSGNFAEGSVATLYGQKGA